MIWKRDRCVQKRPQQKLTQISIFLSELSSFSNLVMTSMYSTVTVTLPIYKKHCIRIILITR